MTYIFLLIWSRVSLQCFPLIISIGMNTLQMGRTLLICWWYIMRRGKFLWKNPVLFKKKSQTIPKKHKNHQKSLKFLRIYPSNLPLVICNTGHASLLLLPWTSTRKPSHWLLNLIPLTNCYPTTNLVWKTLLGHQAAAHLYCHILMTTRGVFEGIGCFCTFLWEIVFKG